MFKYGYAPVRLSDISRMDLDPLVANAPHKRTELILGAFKRLRGVFYVIVIAYIAQDNRHYISEGATKRSYLHGVTNPVTFLYTIQFGFTGT